MVTMRFRIPGRELHIRLFESVETNQGDYHLSEVGLEYADGGVDSVVVGISPYTLKNWFGPRDAAKETVETTAESLQQEGLLDN